MRDLLEVKYECLFLLSQSLTEMRDMKRSMEDQLQRLKASKALDENHIRDLQDQLEAEQHFSVGFYYNTII